MRSVILSMSVSLVLSGAASAAAITPISRQSDMRASTINLGPTIGYVGGGFDPIDTVGSSAMDSSADLLLGGNLYFGPDLFRRLYEGSYGGTQDVTFAPGSLSASLDQAASTTMIDPGDPAASVLRSSVANAYSVKFNVTEATLFELSIEFEGTTQNLGAADYVGLAIRGLDANGDPLPFSMFELAFVAGSNTTSEGTYLTQVFLAPGSGYIIEAVGRVAADGTSSDTSHLSFSLSVPAPGSLAALAMVGLVASRRRVAS